MKRILINLPTITSKGIMLLWLLKFKKIQLLGNKLTIHGGLFLKDIDLKNVDVYRFNDFFEELREIKDANWTKLNFITFSIFRNLKALGTLKTVNKHKYDIVYSPSSVLDLIVFPFILKTFNSKIKWAAVFDNIVPITDPGNKIFRFLAWFFFQLSIFLIRKTDVIFVSTPELFEYLKSRKFNIKKLVQTGFAVENDLIKKASSDKKYNIDALFIGRINETKGIYDMLNVLEIVRKQYPNFQFAIMGDGDETTKKNFKNKILQMNLEKNIQFLGFKSGIEKFNIIKSSRTFWFLSVSKSESFGMALLEAVCCELPSFVYDLIPFRNIYRNGEVIITDIGDYKSVAEKVINLFDKKDFTNRKGSLLLDKYSWDNIAEIEIDALNRL